MNRLLCGKYFALFSDLPIDPQYCEAGEGSFITAAIAFGEG